jgi:hypothetical protein
MSLRLARGGGGAGPDRGDDNEPEGSPDPKTPPSVENSPSKTERPKYRKHYPGVIRVAILVGGSGLLWAGFVYLLAK